MALDLSACKRLQKASAELGVKLSVAHYRRNLPLFVEVKKLIDQGLIGDIKELSITMLKKTNLAANDPNNWRVDPSIAGGGYFYDLAPHQIDLVFYFLGNMSFNPSKSLFSSLKSSVLKFTSVVFNLRYSSSFANFSQSISVSLNIFFTLLIDSSIA